MDVPSGVLFVAEGVGVLPSGQATAGGAGGGGGVLACVCGSDDAVFDEVSARVRSRWGVPRTAR